MKRVSLVLVALALLLAASLRVADANKTHEATLTGAAEVGGGDPDGSGRALIGLSPSSRQICFTIDVSNIAPATAAHIHRGAAGADGPVVVALTAPTNGSSIGCVEVDAALLKEIMRNPGDFYVNVLNADYPDGAIRGQLTR
ncbi:MAG TPA: CHRD domain-containing protein [Candidatus Eisenbacteria bacterium]|nr:CHRD domain-containing protein [Candidatus Eisenbacteria bacterium]